MLDDLIAYLRAALPHLRESSSSLKKEVNLAHAWLRIVHSRSDLASPFTFELDEHARDTSMPPMILLPMIACTLEDSACPPLLRVRTRAQGGRLNIEIVNAASARAHAEPAVARTIRERLHEIYGNDATLDVAWSESAGLCATLELPDESADRDHR